MKRNIKKMIPVGSTVEIPVTVESEKVVLKTSIEGVGDDNKLIIGAPLYKLSYYSVRTGDILRLHIKLESGIIEFKTKVLRRVKVRNLMTIVLEAISEPILIQRREFFRLNILKDILVSHGERSFSLMTKEISAGGLSGIVTDIGDVNVGEKVSIKFDIGSELLTIMGEILYCMPFKESIRRYEYRIKYIDVSQGERTKLLNYIFNEQRKLMRKK